MKKLLLFVGLVAIVATTSAQTPPDNEIWYTTHNGETPAFFTDNNLSSLLTHGDDKVVIKFDDSIDINYIISNAFRNWTGLTSITLGNGVTRIADDAFNGCFCLKSVTIPNSVTEIGQRVFKGCYTLDSLTIPNSVTKIGESAFEACGISSLIIPNSVTEIGRFAFKDCDIENITISNSVTEIGEGAFNSCYDLENITIPNSVTKIGDNAFRDCSNLENVTISNSVTEIGEYAFHHCHKLVNITVPNSVTKIGRHAFHDCGWLDKMTVTIGSGVTEIGDRAFAGCYGELIINCNIPDGKHNGNYYNPSWYYPFQDSRFETVIIGNGVTKIGDYAFRGCTSLKSITIPDSVTEIGYNAFGGCRYYLESITIPNSVTKIEDEVFYNCCSLKSITIGSGVTEIKRDTFYGCTPDSIIVSNRYCYDYFKDKGGKVLLNSKYLSQDGRCVIVNGELTFCQLSGLLKYDIPKEVTKIGQESLKGYSNITSITIPDGVTEICSKAFNGCSGLTNIVIPESVTKIEGNVFEGCSMLKSVKVGNALCYDILAQSGLYISAFIGSNASADGRCLINNGKLERFIATGLTSYDFPGSVNEISAEALNECKKLQSATVASGQCYDILAQSGVSISAFTGSNASADGKCLINNGELIVFIGNGMTEYVIPQNVTKIHNAKFNNCNMLTNITIPSGVTTIGDQQFRGCSALANITVLATTPPAISDLGIAETVKIYVPASAIKAYKKEPTWAKYNKQIKPLK